jgi:hypothetical protein
MEYKQVVYLYRNATFTAYSQIKYKKMQNIFSTKFNMHKSIEKTSNFKIYLYLWKGKIIRFSIY